MYYTFSAVYFSSYSRAERELSDTVPPSPSKSIASQSSALQATQHTQTTQKVHSSRETQTAHSTPSAENIQTTSPSPTNQFSHQSTQSQELLLTSQATQSTVPQKHQSSQSDDVAERRCIDGRSVADRTKRLSTLPGSCGLTLELCAGIVDKQIPLKEIAREEVLEECGYDVPADSLQQIISYRFVLFQYFKILIQYMKRRKNNNNLPL